MPSQNLEYILVKPDYLWKTASQNRVDVDIRHKQVGGWATHYEEQMTFIKKHLIGINKVDIKEATKGFLEKYHTERS